MVKTYIPKANDEAEDLHRYLTRYQAKLMAGVLTPPSAEQLEALADLLVCLVTFIQRWPKPPPDVGP